jgi:hypothetical protein
LKFKIDENLPFEFAAILREAGFEADTVADENLSGAADALLAQHARANHRVLITLDMDFANIQSYPLSAVSPVPRLPRQILAVEDMEAMPATARSTQSVRLAGCSCRFLQVSRPLTRGKS